MQCVNVWYSLKQGHHILLQVVYVSLFSIMNCGGRLLAGCALHGKPFAEQPALAFRCSFLLLYVGAAAMGEMPVRTSSAAKTSAAMCTGQ